MTHDDNGNPSNDRKRASIYKGQNKIREECDKKMDGWRLFQVFGFSPTDCVGKKKKTYSCVVKDASPTDHLFINTVTYVMAVISE